MANVASSWLLFTANIHLKFNKRLDCWIITKFHPVNVPPAKAVSDRCCDVSLGVYLPARQVSSGCCEMMSA